MLKRVPRYLWLLFLLALAFSPDAKLHRLKLVHLEWSLLAILVAWTWAGLKDGWVLRRTALDLPILSFTGVFALLYAFAPEKSVAGLELHRILLGATAFFIASATTEEDARGRNLFAWTWSLLAGLLGLSVLWSRLSSAGSDRAMASFGNPILFAAFLVPAVFLTIGLISSGRTRYGSGWALLVLQFFALSASGTRAAYLALGVTGTAMVWAQGTGRLAKVAGSVLLLGGAIGAFFLVSRPVTHTLIWRDTLRLWLDHPLFGVGPGRFHLEFPAYASPALKALWPQSEVVVNHAHNEYLQLLSESGVIGLGLLAWILMVFARSTGSDPRRGLTPSRPAFFWAAASLWVMAFASPDMRFAVSFACAFVLMAFAAPETGHLHIQPPAPARGLLAAAVTAFALWTASRVPLGALAAQGLDEPNFFAASAQVDAELAHWLSEAQARPQDPLVYENLGYYFAKKSRFDEAAAAFARSLALDPKRAGPLNNLANLYFMQGKTDMAMAAWEDALQRDPALTDARMNLAIVYYSKGKLKESTHELEAILKQDPKNEKAQALLRRMAE